MLHERNGQFLGVNGTIYWYKNDKLHCKDGPAIIHIDGTNKWFQDGKLHREDGPAITYSTGGTEWWYLDEQYKNVQEFAKVAGWTDKQLAEYLLSN